MLGTFSRWQAVREQIVHKEVLAIINFWFGNARETDHFKVANAMDWQCFSYLWFYFEERARKTYYDDVDINHIWQCEGNRLFEDGHFVLQNDREKNKKLLILTDC
jgi:hypothetical protein